MLGKKERRASPDATARLPDAHLFVLQRQQQRDRQRGWGPEPAVQTHRCGASSAQQRPAPRPRALSEPVALDPGVLYQVVLSGLSALWTFPGLLWSPQRFLTPPRLQSTGVLPTRELVGLGAHNSGRVLYTSGSTNLQHPRRIRVPLLVYYY